MLLKTKAVEMFYLRCKVDGLSPKTILNYEKVLSSFERFLGDLPLKEVTTTLLRAYFFELKGRNLRPASLATHYRNLKVFFSFLVREGIFEKNPIDGINKPRLPSQFPHVLEEHQVQALLKVAKKRRSFEGVRDYTILLAFLDTGIRRGELLGLDTRDADLSNRSLKVRGKGSKERTVYFGRKLAKALHKYFEARGYKPCEEALFITRSGERLKERNINQMIERLEKRAKIDGVRVSPHAFRHTFATSYIRNGGDPFTLQRLLGHSDIKTVMIYVHMVGRDLKEAHARYSPIDNMDR